VIISAPLLALRQLDVFAGEAGFAGLGQIALSFQVLHLDAHSAHIIFTLRKVVSQVLQSSLCEINKFS